jgi:hypothetical protein
VNLAALRGRPIPKRAAAVALALAAAAGVVAGRDTPVPVAAEPAALERPARAAPVPAEIDLSRLKRFDSAALQNDPFAPRSFAPPAQPTRKTTARAEKPSAPPLPFQYFGKWVANGATEVFVMRGDELISVAAGITIGGEYRVDAVSESQIAFTYLPLKTRQSLDLVEKGG